MTERNRDAPASQYEDKETQDILNALHRAARRAHKVAHQHKTGVVVSADPPISVEVESVSEVLCVVMPPQERKPYSFGGRWH